MNASIPGLTSGPVFPMTIVIPSINFPLEVQINKRKHLLKQKKMFSAYSTKTGPSQHQQCKKASRCDVGLSQTLIFLETVLLVLQHKYN